MEEQTSGTIVAKKFKWPSKRGQEGFSYCPKYSKLSYDHFGGRLEQSNPPPRLHRAAAARLLSRSDKYKSLYKRNILTSIFVEYKDCICQNSSVTGQQPPGEDVGESCSVPAANQIVVAQFQIFWAIAGAFLSTF